jgi:hypothetical protein
MRYGDKNEHSFVMDRLCQSHNFPDQVQGRPHSHGPLRVPGDRYGSLSLCGIMFRAASKGNKQAKGMIGNLLDSIERACDAAKTPGEKCAKKLSLSLKCQTLE